MVKRKMYSVYKFTEQQLLELEANLTAIMPKLLKQDRILVNKILIYVQANGEIAVNAYNKLYESLMKYLSCNKEYIILFDGHRRIEENKISPKTVRVDEAYYAVIQICRIMLFDVNKRIDNAATIGSSKAIKSRGIIRNGI